jgi:hypothetical protein
LITFEQAYYGATPSGHNLLACDPKLRSRFLLLLDRTDLQGVVPAGIDIESYLCAFRSEADFVVMRLSPDKSVARGGMIFSHVLLTPIEHIGNLNSLMALAKILQAQRTPDLNTETLILDDEFVDQEQNVTLDVEPLKRRCIALANALVAKRDSVIVWSGTDDFLSGIDLLWRSTWPELRKMLTFALAFTPQDAHLADFSVVCTPASEVNRWTGFQVVTDRSVSQSPSPAAVALIGGPSSESLRETAREVRWSAKNLADLEYIASLQKSLTEPQLLARDAIRNLRLLCFLASNTSTATSLKSTLLERASTSISSADGQDLLACRNLSLDCFRGAERFWVALTQRVVAFIKENLDLPDAGEFLVKANKESSSPWKGSITEGLRTTFQSFSPTHASALWSWIMKSPELAMLLFSVLPDKKSAETILEESYPTCGLEGSISAILKVLDAREMPRLAAKLAHTYLPADEAFDWRLSTTDGDFGLSELVQLYSPRVVVVQCARTADNRLEHFAKMAIVKTPELLQEADLGSNGWKRILIALRGSGLRFIPGEKFDLLQGQMLDLSTSTPQGEDFWTALEELGLFDFSSSAHSEQIWKRLPRALLDRAVRASADATIAQIAAGGLTLTLIANELRAELQDRLRLLKALGELGFTKAAQQVRLFRTFQELAEQDFINWYSSFLRSVRPVTAHMLGEIGSLIVDRRWSVAAGHTAREILDYRRTDLTPILSQIRPLLGIKQVFKLMIVGVSSTAQELSPDDLWSQLEDVLAEHFPGGPRDYGLWSRSKGQDADLLVGNSGREQWRHAVQMLRRETNGSATLYNLLQEAQRLFPYDASLQWFQQHCRFMNSRS